jgi:hypothetical protein
MCQCTDWYFQNVLNHWYISTLVHCYINFHFQINIMSFLTQGFALTCDDNSTIGGVRRLFLINRDKVSDFLASSADHSYTEVTVDDTADAASQWHQFEFADYSLNATFENSLEDNGTNFVSYTVTGFIPRQEKDKAHRLQQAIKSCKLIAIVENNQGEAFVYATTSA